MDYKSQKTMTRKTARIIAKIMRKLFGYNDDEVIDPIAMIELVPDIIPNTFISIVENDKLDVNVPARCYFSNNNIIMSGSSTTNNAMYDIANKRKEELNKSDYNIARSIAAGS